MWNRDPPPGVFSRQRRSAFQGGPPVDRRAFSSLGSSHDGHTENVVDDSATAVALVSVPSPGSRLQTDRAF